MVTKFPQVSTFWDESKTNRVTRKEKYGICFSKVALMLEMLRNWEEPAMSAPLIYQIINFFRMISHKSTLTEKEAETMHFTFIKESICREHRKCGKYNHRQAFLTFYKCSQEVNQNKS